MIERAEAHRIGEEEAGEEAAEAAAAEGGEQMKASQQKAAGGDGAQRLRAAKRDAERFVKLRERELKRARDQREAARDEHTKRLVKALKTAEDSAIAALSHGAGGGVADGAGAADSAAAGIDDKELIGNSNDVVKARFGGVPGRARFGVRLILDAKRRPT